MQMCIPKPPVDTVQLHAVTNEYCICSFKKMFRKKVYGNRKRNSHHSQCAMCDCRKRQSLLGNTLAQCVLQIQCNVLAQEIGPLQSAQCGVNK